jgi:hypothetical protein
MGEQPDTYGNPPTAWQNFRRLGGIESDVRAIRQTLDEQIIPTQQEMKSEVRQLRARFVYALTMIGSAIGAIVYLVLQAGRPL